MDRIQDKEKLLVYFMRCVQRSSLQKHSGLRYPSRDSQGYKHLDLFLYLPLATIEASSFTKPTHKLEKMRVHEGYHEDGKFPR